MMVGTVTPDREVVFRLKLHHSASAVQELQELDVVLDTGFTDFLTLPASLVDALHLPHLGSTPVVLADGSEVLLDTYQARVEWGERSRRIQALAAEGTALIGMSLLYGSLVTLSVVDGGRATIEPLS